MINRHEIRLRFYLPYSDVETFDDQPDQTQFVYRPIFSKVGFAISRLRGVGHDQYGSSFTASRGSGGLDMIKSRTLDFGSRSTQPSDVLSKKRFQAFSGIFR
jgi:hypothetical protein